MTLLDQITQAWKDALKAREKNRAEYLSYLRSRIQDVGKNSKPPRDATDSDAIAALRKQYAENNEVIETTGDKLDPEARAILEGKNAIIMSFLPPQMSEDELRAAITNAIGDQPKSMKLMKTVMAELQEKYEGKYENKQASAIAKEMLTG